MKRVFQWLLRPAVIGTLGLLALSLIIWWIGPLIAIAGAQPLGSVLSRVLVLLLLWALWLGRLAWVAWRRRKTNAALIAGMSAGASASDKEAKLLAERFSEAVQRLKTSGGKSWLGGQQHLYELPWYVFVGAPGSGKTTALMHAGLQFLLGDAAKGSVKGVGGTRNCEWWFTQDAVLIDTAGRYATQESDRDVDASAWNNFLALLKKTRPRQPINGVLLTVNVQDMLQQGPQERKEHAAQLRARLQELQTRLGVSAPVYVLVTKADLIGGFNESFEALSKEDRDQVWGFTFDVAQAQPLAEFDRCYQDLRQRLVAQLVDRLEGERDVLKRSAMFAFPQEMASLQSVLGDFLRQVVSEGGSLEAAPRIRGVYFTSGTQEGSPIDRVMGALGRSFGIDARSAMVPGGRGKSFFLHRLLRDVVFAERGLGLVSPAAERRRRVLRLSAVAGVCVVGVACLTGWAISRARNLDQAQQVQARIPALKATVDALPPPTSADVAPLPGPLTQVHEVARPDGFDVAHPPFLNGLGLYQGEKLDAAAQLSYHRLLQKTLMPRVVRRMEERLRAANKDNLENAYEALKAYVMLYNPDQFDAATLKAWIAVDWDSNYARMVPEQRVALDGHLDALLSLGPPRPELPRDEALVATARELLGSYPLEYRVYSRIKRQYRPGDAPEFSVAGAAGTNGSQVFVRASGEPLTKGVSGFYTKQGYESLVKPAVQKASLKLAQEESWVLGLKSDPARLKDLTLGTGLTDKVKRLYCEEYIKTWDALLADVGLVKLAGLERSIAVARILSAVDSPLASYLRAVSEQTTLVPPATAPGALDKLGALAKSETAKLVGAAPVDTGSGGPVERMVDDHFANLHRQVAGQPAPIDDTLKMFGEVYAQLSAVDAAQKSKSPPPPGGSAERIKVAAGQQPQPLRGMLEQLADVGVSQSRGAEIQGMSADLKPITDVCNRTIAGRYPFAKGARADVLPDDMGQVFGAGGLMDDFFQRRLGALVDVSGSNWSYRPLGDGSRPVGTAALADFQRAARIRDVFFRAGGKQPSIRVEMRLLELDPSLKELVLDVDGVPQKMVLGGPSVALSVPSQRLVSQIKLGGVGPAGAGQVLTFEGPWALFRLFDRFSVEPAAVPEKFNVSMNLDGRRAKVEVVSSSAFNPFQMREMTQFRCPSAL
jgi:type VI secretion system protein ImpL